MCTLPAVGCVIVVLAAASLLLMRLQRPAAHQRVYFLCLLVPTVIVCAHRRPTRHELNAGRSMRPAGGPAAVSLLAADNQFDESRQIAEHLQRWHKRGYAWSDMAVLCRTKEPVRESCIARVRC